MNNSAVFAEKMLVTVGARVKRTNILDDSKIFGGNKDHITTYSVHIQQPSMEKMMKNNICHIYNSGE